MVLNKEGSQIFIPDSTLADTALERTTHLAVAAHQDDIELMAMHGILECFGVNDKWFCGIVTSDGAGSPRNGLYKDFSDSEMKALRFREQKKAAVVGEYSALVMLDYSSAEIKTPDNSDIIADYVKLFTKIQPKYVYTHNLADKHDTHIGVVAKVIMALRLLPDSIKPEKVYGCEVWRDLDWACDTDKVILDTSAHPNISSGLVSVFDSQICGGKRYDLAAAGRKTANATFGASHVCDAVNAVSYAMDLTPLIQDKNLDITKYVLRFIKNFENDVKKRIEKQLNQKS